MNIIFTGTGSGRTSLKRFHSSFIIDTGKYRLLMDAGEGISKALLSQSIDYNSIDAVIFSHMHPDHSAGFPSLLVQMKMHKRDKELIIFLHPGHEKNVRSLLHYTYVLPARLPFRLRFRYFKEDSVTEVTEGLGFRAAFNSHLDDLKENLKADEKAFSFGFLFYLNDKKVFYSSDVGTAEDLYLFSSEHADYIIAESTHIEVHGIIEVFNDLKPRKLYLTHIPDDNDSDKNEFPENILPLKDGDIISV